MKQIHQCWNCGVALDDLPRPISRHAACPRCFNELHCCRLCRHYDPAQTMRCGEDRADPPLNKENANFCDFYAPRFGAFAPATADKSSQARDDLQALFGKPPTEPAGDGPTDAEPGDADAAPAAAEEESTLSKEELARRKLDDLFD